MALNLLQLIILLSFLKGLPHSYDVLFKQATMTHFNKYKLINSNMEQVKDRHISVLQKRLQIFRITANVWFLLEIHFLDFFT